MKILRSVMCICLFPLLCVSTALAQEQKNSSNNAQSEVVEKKQEDEITLGVGGTVSSSPYKNYSTQWAGYPVLSYEGNYAYIRGFKAGLKVINLDFLEASIYGGYDSTSFDPAKSSNSAIRALNTRHASAMAGGQVMLKTPYGMVYSSVEGDVLGHSNGVSGEFGYMNSFDIGDFEIIPVIGAFWNDSKYNTYYYGVSSREAIKSGLHDYSAGGGISPHVSLTLDYSLTDDLEIYWNGQVTFLSSAIKNSPMVGRETAKSISMGLTYTFDIK